MGMNRCSSVGPGPVGPDPNPSPSLLKKPAFALNRNQQQPSDFAFLFTHQNDAASTNQNDAAALQQLMTDSFRNNQQLVTKRYIQNAAFQLIKKTSPHYQQLATQTNGWSLKPTAGHSTESSLSQSQLLICATITAVNTKKLTNTCRFLVNPRTRASASNSVSLPCHQQLIKLHLLTLNSNTDVWIALLLKTNS
ncbi:hypothetical protein F511_37326 [Dorcoceras hygrometricum]|uniref:Uncharacterized protein n=1 Tax=Dorcoceras hygrometricum TaxID=472368 RepID=A0A2Z7B000_9LAMI|nr:hypothetical protein F511_37326 [Dorcoceras hygrometricum]